MLTGATLERAGIDAVALKPAGHDLEAACELSVESLVVDYEGREHFPTSETLSSLAAAADRELLVTTPVRADGFDPLGDESLLERLPAAATRILVAGNAAFLTPTERARAIAPRLSAARERAPTAWVGTEGIERLALAVGGTQFELLGPDTVREVQALRAAGLEVPIAVYAPTVLTADADAVLDALGGYVARREPVRAAIAADAPTNAAASGHTREVLLAACHDYGLVGDVETVHDRVRTLTQAGVDRVVAYPARGLEAVR